MVAVIIVDAYPFLGFSDLICHLEAVSSYRFFLFALCRLIVRRPNFNGSSDQEAPPSASKNASFSAMSRIEMCPYSYFR